MLTFTELTKKLVRGQLKNTNIRDENTIDEVLQEYLPTLLQLTNDGLRDISARMPIFTQQVDLTFVPEQYVYKFDTTGAGSYLTAVAGDTFVPEDFVKVLDIWDSNGDRHVHDTNGHILTPTYDTLRFTKAKMEALGEKVRIRYQAKHTGVEEDGTIVLPPNLETALQLFVASLYLSHMNGEQHSKKGDQYFGAYLRHLGEDETRNTSSVSEIQEDTRFEDRGFV